jgi:hypothetical protein
MEKYPGDVFTPALAIHVANVLYYRHRPDEIIGRRLEINMPVIERLGLQEAFGEWEGICAGIMQDQAA